MEDLSMFQRHRSVALEYEKPETYGMVLTYPLDRLAIPKILQEAEINSRRHKQFLSWENPQKRDKKPTGPNPVNPSTINNNGYIISSSSSTRVSQQSTEYVITTDGININSPQSGYLKSDIREGNITNKLYPNDQHYTRNNILKSHKK
ncbi:hypothetical protein PIB30_045377 [Stylosanthes scabra]|uniref:Uncharacterized protein n=1 Tax=Stylosanthes scabra TaxID=79078 RepID=A0ABU6TFU9_9FABA|nr:hypothetical protein [Stylosanthes scabra]